jgi:catechol 2,3-dioxygenase-like lactoylglutathione lyase family enzyme
MKRFHVHVSVPDLEQSIRFYSALFAAAPSVVKSDYAKWMIEDPRVNFAISQRGEKAGLNHLGLQTDSDAELEVLHGQLQQADLATEAEQDIACCYARSNKYWVTDPTGIAWETFHTLGSIPTFSGPSGGKDDEINDPAAVPAAGKSACCAPAAGVAAPAAVTTLSAKIPVKAKACAG